jgi:membrane protease YdiL (CAAX protease family)
MLRQRRSMIFLEITLIVLLIILRVPLVTILLFFLGWLSLWFRGISWMEIGLKRPENWGRLILIALALGTIYQVFSIWILTPILTKLTQTPIDLSHFDTLPGNLGVLAGWLLLSWGLAAFGEEMAFRGYLLNRLADLFGNHRWIWLAGLLGSAILFGLGHLYQGITGVLETFVFALFLGWLYLSSGRNLWYPIIVHGVANSIGFGLIFLGLYP